MGAFRPIATDDFATIQAATADLGAAPMLQWLKIADLVVDDSYQRPLAGKGRSTVRAIAEAFDWSKFSPVIVAPVEGGRYAIIDGQHRTTGAALRGVESVPCQVVIADRAAQASAFASINGNTTRMTALALHRAAVGAGEPEACLIDQVAARVGVRILRGPTAQKDLKPGDTMAISVLVASLRAYGAPAVETGLACITRTRHNQPGMVSAVAIRGLAAVAAEASDHAALIAAVGRIDLAGEIRKADAMRMGGIAGWKALAERLKARLGEAGRGVAAPAPKLEPTVRAPVVIATAISPPAPPARPKPVEPVRSSGREPGHGEHKLDACRYLAKKGVAIQQPRLGEWRVDGRAVAEGDVVSLVNQHRREAGLRPITAMDLA